MILYNVIRRRDHSGAGMTKWANKLNKCLQTFHKEVLHDLDDLKRSPGSQDNMRRINVGTYFRSFIASAYIILPEIAPFAKEHPIYAVAQVAMDSHCESHLYTPATFYILRGFVLFEILRLITNI